MSNEVLEVPDFAIEMLRTYLKPEIQELLTNIKSIAGYKSPPEIEGIFKGFHNYITNPQPAYITRLRENPKLEPWYHRHVNGILGNTQSALACVLYHRDNLLSIERAIFELDAIQKCKNIISERSTIGIGHGNSLKLDFEYQAYILAVRRCLEYMTYGLYSYFKNHTHSFRELSGALESFVKKGNPVAIALTETHQIWRPKFNSVVADERGNSIRDRISHFEHIPAGTLNISSRGLVLVGGGEDLNLGVNSALISEILNKRTDNLVNCIKAFIDAFISAPKPE